MTGGSDTPERAAARTPVALSNLEHVDYDPSRCDELIVLWRKSFEAALAIVDFHPLDEQKDYFLTEVLPHNSVRLALLDGTLLGFIAASRESISHLYVKVGYQRHGIGTALLEWAKRESNGSLWLYTFARNSVARAFYERHGFIAGEHGADNMWGLEDVRYYWRL